MKTQTSMGSRKALERQKSRTRIIKQNELLNIDIKPRKLDFDLSKEHETSKVISIENKSEYRIIFKVRELNNKENR